MKSSSPKASKGKKAVKVKDLRPSKVGRVKGGKEPGKIEFPNV